VRLAFRTTGCKVNQFDSGTVMAAVADLPVVLCGPDDGADIVVVNACTVTMNADRDGRAAAYRAGRTGARVVLAGCLATRLEDQGTADSMPQEMIVVGGTADRGRLIETLRNLIIRTAADMATDGGSHATADENARQAATTVRLDNDSDGDGCDDDTGPGARSRPLVKIQDGCDCRCSYCIVPLVRGPSISFDIAGIRDQVLRAAESGAAEIVLTGVDLAAWGRCGDGRYGHLASLLEHVTGLGTGARFRLSSLEPYGLDSGLIDAIAAGHDICPHIHIPMQSGSDTVLARMNRPYSAQRFAELVETAAARIPGLVLGMDVIVGFPGETDAEFEQTRDMILRLPTTYLHVFPYSRRPGTPAADAADQIPDGVRKERGRLLRAISTERRAKHVASLVGRRVEVVDIRPFEGGVEALAADYTRVRIANRFDMMAGRRMIAVTDAEGAVATGMDEI